jgi:alkaline phosphatase
MRGRKKAAVWFLLIFAFVLIGFAPAQGADPKNVILLIGDGMGPEAVGLAIYYNRFMNGADKPLNMERLMAEGNTGYCLTYQYGTVVTDSASAATALASGVKTRDAMIGKDHDGRPMKTIVDVAAKLGKSTGVLSDTRLTHATPAGFYASIIHRDMESDIAAQFVDRGDVTVALSSGAQFFIPKGTKVEEHPDLRGTTKAAGWGTSKREDSRDLVREAKAKGYAIVANESELSALDPRGTDKVLGLIGATAFPSAIDRQPHHNTGVPRLSTMTTKALEILGRNPRGFFLMVEGGQVDWVEHANDVASVLHEMLEFDQAIGVAMSFAESNPDTLVVVTADHDTGGMAIAYNSYLPPAPVKLASGETWKTKYNFNEGSIFRKMAAQKKSFARMVADSQGDPAALKKEVEENSGFAISPEQAAALLARDPSGGYPPTQDFPEFFVYTRTSPTAQMARLFGKDMGTAWAVGTHTHTPVMVFAQGPSSYRFRGLLDNTHIPRIMADEWGASLPAPK